MSGNQNYINHIVLVLDRSGSMHHLADSVVRVADAQIQYLAQRSKELDQETRITVYTFNERPECIFYDKDVLRMPSLRNHFSATGQTALVDATLKALDDLALTPEIYGDHAFLVYVLTDGQENHSTLVNRGIITNRLNNLKDNWTVAVLVPDQSGVFEAKRFGFPANNIQVWDTSSTKGVEEVGRTIRQATENFMVGRSQGQRGSRNLFTVDASKLTAQVVDRTLGEIRSFELFKNTRDVEEIRPFVERRTRRNYVLGNSYYQLVKTETIQPQKQICLFEKRTGKVFSGTPARKLLGLPDYEVKVQPTQHPDYDIFVQSSSVNRKLMPNQQVLVLR